MRGVFVGRERELEKLEQAWGDAVRGAGSFALVSGEPGIGKTRLAEELAQRAIAGGALVAWGRSWEGEGTPAYWPWLQILRALASAPLQHARFAEAERSQPELATLLGGGAVATSDPEQARFRLFDGVTRLLAQAAGEQAIVLVLDDLHAADISTLSLLHFLGRALRGTRLLVIGTARDASFHPTPRASELLAKCAREALNLALGRLDRDELTRWMNVAEPRLVVDVDRVLHTSEGNPLFITELIASAQQRPHLPGAWSHQVPFGIREAVREHLSLCSQSAQRLLETASLLGRDLARSTLLALMDEPRDAVATVDEALATGIVEPAGSDRLRFSHVLLRDELYARIGADRRGELHRAAAAVLSREGADAATVAHHQLLGVAAASTVGAASEAVQTVLAAMREGSMRLAFEDAAQLGERALGLLAPSLAPREECRLRIAVGEAWIVAGRESVGRAECARAVELASSARDPELAARAALACAVEPNFARNEEAIALLRQALAALPPGDSSLRAEVMGRLSAALVGGLPNEVEELLRLRQESVAMTRRLGDEVTLFATLRLATSAFPEQVAPRERLALNAEMIALAERLGQIPRAVSMLGWQVACRFELGDPEGAAHEAATAERLLSRLTQPHYRWRMPLIRALLATMEGRFAEAELLQREALRIAEEGEVREGLMIFHTVRMNFQYVRGDSDGFSEFEEKGERLHRRLPMFAIFRSISDAMCGRIEQTRAALDLVRTLPLETIPGVFILGWPCVVAGLTEHAEFFYDLVTARTSMAPLLVGPGGMGILGPTAFLLGRLAAMLGRDDAASEHYRSALEVSQRIRALPYVAQIELAWAELESRRGTSRWRERAQRALTIARELGMRGVAARAGVLLSATRDSQPHPTPEPAPQIERAVSLTRTGDVWSLARGDTQLQLKDGKGLAYLEALVREPHRELHVLELVGADEEGDAGPLLDGSAKAAYRARADELGEELAEATRHNDLGRMERARAELDALGAELSRAVGLGGRDRRAGSAPERARINVQRRLRDVIRRITALDPVLGRHLERSVRTGLFCVYSPTWPDDPS